MRYDGNSCGERPPFSAQIFDFPTDHHDIGMLLQPFDLPFQLIRRPQIIIVEHGDIFRPRHGDSGIARRGLSAVCLANKSNPPLVRQRLKNILSPVGRPVINHNDFKISVNLGKDRFQRGHNKLAMIVSRNDHAHRRQDSPLRKRLDLKLPITASLIDSYGARDLLFGRADTKKNVELDILS